MKKIMFGLAAAAAIAAFGTDIESANTVGYTKQDFMAKSTYYMMGAQFETTAGTALKLSDLDFGDMTGAPLYDDALNFKKSAPQVQVAFANREGFDDYYYLADGNITEPGWVDATGEPADPSVIAGLGFWFYNPINAAPALTTVGAIVSDAVVEKTFDNSYRVLVNPYPVETKLSDITFGNILAQSPAYDDALEFKRTAPQIQVPFADREGFDDYYYLSDGNITEPGWVDATGEPADPTIPVGRGCWFKQSASSMTVTFTAP